MGLRIYMVEESERLRGELAQALQSIAGAQVAGAARSESEAKEWLADHPLDWDLVLVDLNLLAGSGFGVVRHCRSRAPSQKVIVFTSYAPEHVRQQCRTLGADEVFDKGREKEEMLACCKELRLAAEQKGVRKDRQASAQAQAQAPAA